MSENRQFMHKLPQASRRSSKQATFDRQTKSSVHDGVVAHSFQKRTTNVQDRQLSESSSASSSPNTYDSSDEQFQRRKESYPQEIYPSARLRSSTSLDDPIETPLISAIPEFHESFENPLDSPLESWSERRSSVATDSDEESHSFLERLEDEVTRNNAFDKKLDQLRDDLMQSGEKILLMDKIGEAIFMYYEGQLTKELLELLTQTTRYAQEWGYKTVMIRAQIWKVAVLHDMGLTTNIPLALADILAVEPDDELNATDCFQMRKLLSGYVEDVWEELRIRQVQSYPTEFRDAARAHILEDEEAARIACSDWTRRVFASFEAGFDANEWPSPDQAMRSVMVQSKSKHGWHVTDQQNGLGCLEREVDELRIINERLMVENRRYREEMGLFDTADTPVSAAPQASWHANPFYSPLGWAHKPKQKVASPQRDAKAELLDRSQMVNRESQPSWSPQSPGRQPWGTPHISKHPSAASESMFGRSISMRSSYHGGTQRPKSVYPPSPLHLRKKTRLSQTYASPLRFARKSRLRQVNKCRRSEDLSLDESQKESSQKSTSGVPIDPTSKTSSSEEISGDFSSPFLSRFDDLTAAVMAIAQPDANAEASTPVSEMRRDSEAFSPRARPQTQPIEPSFDKPARIPRADTSRHHRKPSSASPKSPLEGSKSENLSLTDTPSPTKLEEVAPHFHEYQEQRRRSHTRSPSLPISPTFRSYEDERSHVVIASNTPLHTSGGVKQQPDGTIPHPYTGIRDFAKGFADSTADDSDSPFSNKIGAFRSDLGDQVAGSKIDEAVPVNMFRERTQEFQSGMPASQRQEGSQAVDSTQARRSVRGRLSDRRGLADKYALDKVAPFTPSSKSSASSAISKPELHSKILSTLLHTDFGDTPSIRDKASFVPKSSRLTSDELGEDLLDDMQNIRDDWVFNPAQRNAPSAERFDDSREPYGDCYGSFDSQSSIRTASGYTEGARLSNLLSRLQTEQAIAIAHERRSSKPAISSPLRRGFQLSEDEQHDLRQENVSTISRSGVFTGSEHASTTNGEVDDQDSPRSKTLKALAGLGTTEEALISGVRRSAKAARAALLAKTNASVHLNSSEPTSSNGVRNNAAFDQLTCKTHTSSRDYGLDTPARRERQRSIYDEIDDSYPSPTGPLHSQFDTAYGYNDSGIKHVSGTTANIADIEGFRFTDGLEASLAEDVDTTPPDYLSGAGSDSAPASEEDNGESDGDSDVSLPESSGSDPARFDVPGRRGLLPITRGRRDQQEARKKYSRNHRLQEAKMNSKKEGGHRTENLSIATNF
ncbi:hypothetical protein LTS08_003645 [Lithohypha guttulata]|nr:hypothetical protein LTS08_003645 [Lithohypha guttulata]